MSPEVDLSAALGEIVRGAERAAAAPPPFDAHALVAAAGRRRRRLASAVASAAAVVATGGVGLALTLESPPHQPAAPPPPTAPGPTEPGPAVLGDPETGSVGAAGCGLRLGDLPWRPDDRVQIGSDEGPRLQGADLRIDTWILTEEGDYRVGSDPMDAVVLDTADRVVAYLTEADDQTAAGRLTGVLVPCDAAAPTLRPGSYVLVAAYAFREVAPDGEPIDTTPAHGLGRWDLVVTAGTDASP